MLYFIRHGESEANVLGLFAGQDDDSKLTPRGEQQALDAAHKLLAQGVKIDQIVSSPLLRARRTAEIMAPILGIPIKAIIYDKRAMEYDPGELTDTRMDEVTDEVRNRPHGEEDPVEFQHRVLSLVAELKTQPGNSLLVSHAGIDKTIQAHLTNLDPSKFYELRETRNGEIVELG